MNSKRVKRQPQALQHDPNNERFEHAAPHRQATRYSESIGTPTPNHASLSKSGRVIKRRNGFGWTRRRRHSKYWPARAILEESKTQYLIRYEPVDEGAQCEESWQPKCNASLALVVDWEERGMTRVGNDDSIGSNSISCPPSDDLDALVSIHIEEVRSTMPPRITAESIQGSPIILLPGEITLGDHSNDFDTARGPEQASELVLRQDQQEGIPRPGTTISSILSAEPSAIPEKDSVATVSSSERVEDQTATSKPIEEQAPQGKHRGALSVPSGRLVSARRNLRSLLHGSDERRAKNFLISLRWPEPNRSMRDRRLRLPLFREGFREIPQSIIMPSNLHRSTNEGSLSPNGFTRHFGASLGYR